MGICFCGDLEGVDQGFRASPGREGILEGVALSIEGRAKCCAKLRATNLRRKSPTTSPRTPPEAFWRATMRPKPMAAAMEGGIVAAASLWQARWKASAATGSSSRTLAISAVRPLGPGVVPLRALARLRKKSWGGSCNGCELQNGWVQRLVWVLWSGVGIRELVQSVGVARSQGVCKERLSCPGQFAEAC